MLNDKKLFTKLLNALKADYIVEQGTDGNWIYRKWNSGIAECWCKHTGTGGTNNFTSLTVTYPTGLFVAAPNVQTSGGLNGVARAGAMFTESSLSSCTAYIYNPDNNSNNKACWMFFHAIGKWK